MSSPYWKSFNKIHNPCHSLWILSVSLVVSKLNFYSTSAHISFQVMGWKLQPLSYIRVLALVIPFAWSTLSTAIQVSVIYLLKSCFRCPLLNEDFPDHSSPFSTLFTTKHLALADMICLLSLSMLIELMLHSIMLWDKSCNFNSITQKKIIFLCVESLNIQGSREIRLGIYPRQSFRNKTRHFDSWLSRTSCYLHKVSRQWKRMEGIWATCMSHVENSTHHFLSQYFC